MSSTGRAINMTNSEISMVLWLVGFIMQLVCIKIIWNMFSEYPGHIEFVLLLFILPMASLFFFMAPAWINYLVSKFNLNLFIDRITNPDWIGWLRFTQSKSFRPQIVKRGPLGQTMGVTHGVKADVINQGDYTVTLANGNQAIITHDFLSNNINLEQNANWELIKKHHFLIGFSAWESALDRRQMLHDIRAIKFDDDDEEDIDSDAEEDKDTKEKKV